MLVNFYLLSDGDVQVRYLQNNQFNNQLVSHFLVSFWFVVQAM